MAVHRRPPTPRQFTNIDRTAAVVPPAWMTESPCAGTDPTIFHPERGESNRTAAKRLCWDVCTVREECLEWALEFECRPNNTSAVFGIFGGLFPSERKRIIQERTLGRQS